MGNTPRFRLRFLDRGQPLNETRQVLEDNATTTETALEAVQAFVAQYVSTSAAGPGWSQTLIAADTDGVPYYNPAGNLAQPMRIGLDTDGTPYYLSWSVS